MSEYEGKYDQRLLKRYRKSERDCSVLREALILAASYRDYMHPSDMRIIQEALESVDNKE